MSDDNPPPTRPKPGSLRDRIAAFEQKPASASTPPPPRPKPGALSKWAPKPAEPPSPTRAQPARAEGGMSANDAKASIGAGGSLKERMAALQGIGAFGAPAAAAVPRPPPSDKPKWKPPPQVQMSPPIGEERADAQPSAPFTPPVDPPTSVASPPAEGEAGEGTAATADEEEDATDPEEEERRRRAAIAARMARLGGARVGMGPPVFGKKPTPPPKKPSLNEKTEAVPVSAKEPESSPAAVSDEKDNTVQPTPEVRASTEDSAPVEQGSPAPASPPSMPIPAAPRRAAPPRRKTPKAPEPAPVPASGESMPGTEPLVEAASTPDGAPLSAPTLDTAETVQHIIDNTTHKSPEAVEDERAVEETFAAEEVGEESGNREKAAMPVVERQDDDPIERAYSASSNPRPESSELDDENVHSTNCLTEQPAIERVIAPEVKDGDPELAGEAAEEEQEDDEVRRKRIAERIAKMGGFNPLSATPSAQEGITTHADRHPPVRHEHHDAVGDIEHPTTEAEQDLQEAIVEDQGKPIEEIAQEHEIAEKELGQEEVSAPKSASGLAVPPPPQMLIGGGSKLADEENDGLQDAVEGEDAPEEASERGEYDTYASLGSAPQSARPGYQPPASASSSVYSPPPKRTSIPPPPRRAAPQVGEDDAHEPLLRDEQGGEGTSQEPDEEEGPLPPPPPQPALVPPPKRTSIPPPPKRTSMPPPSRTITSPAAVNEPQLMLEDGASGVVRPQPPGRPPISPPARMVPPPAMLQDDADAEWEMEDGQEKKESAPSRRTSLMVSPPRPARPAPPLADMRDEPTSAQEAPPLPPPTRKPSAPPGWAPSTPGRRSNDDDNAPPPPPPSTRPPPRSQTSIDGRSFATGPPPPPLAARPLQPGKSINEGQPMPSPPQSAGSRRASAMLVASPSPRGTPLSPTPATAWIDSREVMDDSDGDPIDPRFHSPPPKLSPSSSDQRILAASPPPSAGPPPPTFAVPPPPPDTAPPTALSPAEEEDSEQAQRRTIAERMARLGGIRFGAPPAIPGARLPPPQATATEDAPAGESDLPQHGLGSSEHTQEVSKPQEEPEEDEQVRRARIAARLAATGGMRFGMLPGAAPAPSPPVRRPTVDDAGTRVRVTPARAPAVAPLPPAHAAAPPPLHAVPPPPSLHAGPIPQAASRPVESDYEFEGASTSSDGVAVEPEESEAEEIYQEEPEEEEPPPPPPPRPSGRPPLPQGARKASIDIPSQPHSRAASGTAAVPPRPTMGHLPSEYVMVDQDNDTPPPLPASRPTRGPPSRAPPSQPQLPTTESSQWELPSIPSGGLDIGDSTQSDLSESMFSEDSTAYPPTDTTAPQKLVASAPRPIPVNMSTDELMAAWGRVGTRLAEVATVLLERSKRSLVGNGTYAGFVSAVLAQVPQARAPQAGNDYGYLVYQQTGSTVQTRASDIMPGDVVTLEDARLKGHKGLHNYSLSVGEGAPCIGVVAEFETKKVKIKALQANQHVGQATVESVSYRLEDLKSGTIRVYRVLEA